LLALTAAALLYFAGLAAGAVSLIGFEYRSERQTGFTGTSWFPLRLGMPIWLNAGGAVRADYDVQADFGAVILSVAPPLVLKTSLQTASAYVEGKRAGSVLFVAQTPGWYSFSASPTSNGGPRCRGPNTTISDVMIGSAACPTFDVTYTVTWRMADAQQAPATSRLYVPRPHETLVTTRIR
jgi:hypothetical protein